MTTEKRYSLQELRAMKHYELVKVGKPLGVKITKNVNKTEAIKRIMSAYTRATVDNDFVREHVSELERQEAAGELSTHPFPDSEAFEALASDADTDDVMGDEQRGGARPGAGRPKGMTEKKARMNRLPEQPHEMIMLALSGAFELWASKCGVAEVVLTKAEAVELALPLTRLGEYYGVTKWLPEELMLWVAPVWAAHNILKVKRQIIKEAKGGQRNATTPASNTVVPVGSRDDTSEGSVVGPDDSVVVL